MLQVINESEVFFEVKIVLRKETATNEFSVHTQALVDNGFYQGFYSYNKEIAEREYNHRVEKEKIINSLK